MSQFYPLDPFLHCCPPAFLSLSLKLWDWIIQTLPSVWTPVSLPGKFHGHRSLTATVRGVVKSRTRLSMHTNATFIARASQVALVVKNLPGSAVGIRDAGSIPGWESCPGGGNGNPLQNSCLGNPMDRGAQRVTVREMAKSQTRLKRLSTELSESCSVRSCWRSLQCESPCRCCPDRHFHSHFEWDCEGGSQIWASPVPSTVCVLPGSRSQVAFSLRQPWGSREAGDFSDNSSAIEVGASTPGPQWEEESVSGCPQGSGGPLYSTTAGFEKSQQYSG